MITAPTDSLYKFLAIVGVVMVLWGVIFPWKKSLDYNLKLAELKTEIEYCSLKAKEYETAYKLISNNADQSNGVVNSNNEVSIKKRDLYIKYLESQMPLDKKIQTLSIIKETQIQYKLVGLASVAIGLIITIFGFYFWYTKIQKYVDQEIVNNSR